jgi:hypothetical protein
MAVHLRLIRSVLRSTLAAVVALAFASWTLGAQAPKKFYPDDPLPSAVEGQDASGAATFEPDLYLDLILDSFATPGDKTAPSPRAGNVNTIDEVPDSGWFTNRIVSRPISIEDIDRGPGDGPPPNPASWTITRGKGAGVSPGFTATDAAGETWFISFDGPGNNEAGTGAIMAATRIFHTLGYWQVDNRLTSVDPAKLTIAESATIRGRNGKRRPFTRADLEKVFRRSARAADGTYRAAAARLLRGKIVGNFRYYGTRSDDPNDLIPHEHRRELRALQVFGAWTNLIDLKGGNTLDVVVDQQGHGVVRHYLQDVGSTFGTGAFAPRDWDDGWEYLFEGDLLTRRLVTFGWALPTWATVHYDEFPGVGRFEANAFDPREWRPRTPVAAFRHLRADDAFWAARRVMAFDDELIRAAVHTGEFSDPAAEAHLAAVLIQRRDAIGRAYLTGVNPLVNLRLDDAGTLTFENAAVAAKVAEAATAYTAEWARFDNAAGTSTPLGRTESRTTTMAAPGSLPAAAGAFVEVALSATGGAHPAWQQPLRAHFRRTAGGWKLVGLERQMGSRPAGEDGR